MHFPDFRGARPGLAAALLLATVGCTPPPEEGPCDPEVTGQEPCRGQLYYPTGLAHDPDHEILYVGNFNADLRYSGGSVQAVDLAAFHRTVEAFGRLPADRPRLNLTECRKTRKPEEAALVCCQRDLGDPSIVECDEEPFVTSTVKVGNFAGSLRLQTRPDGGRRLWLAVRGDPSITYIDVALNGGAAELRCGDGGAADPKRLASCERQRLTVEDTQAPAACKGSGECSGGDTCVGGRCGLACPPSGCPVGTACFGGRCVECRSDDDCLGGATCDGGLCVRASLRPEPFGLALDEGRDEQGAYSHLVVTHLLGGETTLVDAAVERPASTPEIRPPSKVFLHVRPSFFPADFSGRRAAYAAAPISPGCADSYWFATSRVNSSLAMFRIARSGLLQPVASIPLAPTAFSLGDDVRDLAVQHDSARVLFVQQRPPSLFTVSLDPAQATPGERCRFTGPPEARITSVVPVCQGPSHLGLRQWRERSFLGGSEDTVTRAFVICSTTGQLAIVDPDHDRLVGSLISGRGPNEMTFGFPDLAPPRSPTCGDGKRSGDESAVDCGGSCSRCPTGRACTVGSDCDSGACENGLCAARPRRAYVSNFGESTVAVIDLDRGSDTENRVVARLGLSAVPAQR